MNKDVKINTVIIKNRLYIREDSFIDILYATEVKEKDINVLRETLLKLRYK